MKIIDFIFYYFMKLVILTAMRLLYKLEVKNAPKLNKNNKGVLFVGNHSSWFDTLILTYGVNHRIWFVTGDFILDVPVMRTLVKHLYILPMRKKHGKEGIELAINKLKEGKPVCIFPEGEITPTGEMLRFRSGVSVIQKEANVPIIPFYIDGASEAWSIVQPKLKFFKKITITFGEPYYPKQENNQDASQEIKEQVLLLKPSA